MKRTEPVAPFLRAAPDSVEAGPWTLAGGGELADRVDHWEPLLNLHLEREVTVDVDRLLTSTGVAGAGSIAAAGLWRSERTRLRGPGAIVSLGQDSGTVTLKLMVDVLGASAGGNLDLQTVLMLTTDAASMSPIGARRAGSVLWSHRLSVLLEGRASRFPMEVVDFTSLTGIPDDAPWSLEWYPSDLDGPVMGAMRLLVNRHNRIVVDAVNEEVKSAESVIVASMIHFDVTRSLVFGALGSADFLTRAGDFEPDTVGRLLADLLERFWPGVDPATLARRLAEMPYRLEAEIQNATRFLA